jgi:hypothetical protein
MKASLPELLELVWAHAMPGREVCHQNESCVKSVRKRCPRSSAGSWIRGSRRGGGAPVKLTKALLRTPYAVLG